MQVQLAGVVRGNGLQRGSAPLVAFHRNDPRGAFQEKGTCQPAGARANFNDCFPCKRARRTRYAARQVEVQNKMLAETLSCRQLQVAHHVAERRKSVRTASHATTEERAARRR